MFFVPLAGTGRDLTADSFSTTSMTHQLHCLVTTHPPLFLSRLGLFVSVADMPAKFMMGRIYSGVLDNTTDILPNDWHSHFLHCIDYLRQAIMCSADLTLEIHAPSDADDLGPLDGGWNGHHSKSSCILFIRVSSCLGRLLTPLQFARTIARS